MAIDPNAILEAIFYLMGEEKEITDSPENIHTAMFELKKQHPKLLEDLVFDLDKSFPYCEAIDFAIDCLLAGNILISYLSSRTYRINYSLIQHFERNRQEYGISDEHLFELKQVAKKFYEEVAA